MTRLRRTLAVFAAAGLVVSLAACGSDDDGDADSGSMSTMSPEASDEPSDAMSALDEFGPACASVPTTGPGSFDGMSADPVATAASNNPALSTLVEAVTAADLGATLNSAEALTVFAPSNDAFAAVPSAALQSLLADPKGALTNVLTYHVVEGQLMPDDLAGTHTTLQGTDLTIAGSGEDFTVNGASAVVCGNVRTANATVYIIDGVLTPSA